MNYNEYSESIIKNTPVPAELQFCQAVMWLHPETLPLGLVSLGETKADIIRVPPYAMNRYRRIVPVIAVSPRAFAGNETITDVILPLSIQRFPHGLFAGCTALRNVTIPKKVKEIREGTFAGCVNLENVYYEGTPEEWENVKIVHNKHEIEFGNNIPGTPMAEILAERLIHVPGNDALFTANIHFRCKLEQGKASDYFLQACGKDITDSFRLM